MATFISSPAGVEHLHHQFAHKENVAAISAVCTLSQFVPAPPLCALSWWPRRLRTWRGGGLVAVDRPDRQFRVPAAMRVELIAHARDQQFHVQRRERTATSWLSRHSKPSDGASQAR